nr:MAG: hypothetical protein 1 [Leviviridae sp.]
MYKGEIRATTYAGTQETVSVNHPQWRSAIKSVSDIGSDFFTQKAVVDVNMTPRTVRRVKVIDQFRTQTTTYRGPVLATSELSTESHPQLGWPSKSTSSDALLDSLGAKAIRLVKPTNSLLDLSVFLGELYREGLPRIAGSVLRQPEKLLKRPDKGIADEYLGVTFGWQPILDDAKSFFDMVSRADAVYQQYLRDSGRVVRRRFSFPTEITESSGVLSSGTSAKTASPVSDILDFPFTGRLHYHDKRVVNRWFSGAFTYYLPDLDKAGGLAHYAAVVRKLSGATLDPETVWNLAPWSWAIDWFTNVGDVLSNVSDMATDGLVMRWGYMMEHTIHTRTFSLVGKSGIYGNPAVSPVTLRVETKKRRRANPFGFGLTDAALTLRQKAILVALGISRT